MQDALELEGQSGEQARPGMGTTGLEACLIIRVQPRFPCYLRSRHQQQQPMFPFVPPRGVPSRALFKNKIFDIPTLPPRVPWRHCLSRATIAYSYT
ncbi:hypothetical protein VTH06DRAFT_3052 [Thermothelomyces fergusii]